MEEKQKVNFFKRMQRFDEIASIFYNEMYLEDFTLYLRDCLRGISLDKKSLRSCVDIHTQKTGDVFQFHVVTIKDPKAIKTRDKIIGRYVIPLDCYYDNNLLHLLLPIDEEGYLHDLLHSQSYSSWELEKRKSFVLLYAILYRLPSDDFTKEELINLLATMQADAYSLFKTMMNRYLFLSNEGINIHENFLYPFNQTNYPPFETKEEVSELTHKMIRFGYACVTTETEDFYRFFTNDPYSWYEEEREDNTLGLFDEMNSKMPHHFLLHKGIFDTIYNFVHIESEDCAYQKHSSGKGGIFYIQINDLVEEEPNELQEEIENEFVFYFDEYHHSLPMMYVYIMHELKDVPYEARAVSETLFRLEQENHTKARKYRPNTNYYIDVLKKLREED